MADHNAKNYAKGHAVPPQAVDGGQYGGRVRAHADSINTTTGMVASDRIFIGYLMPGETFLTGWVTHAAHGSGRTLQIGIEGTPNLFMTALSIENAGYLQMVTGSGHLHRNASNVPIPIFATVGGGALAAATDGLKFHYLAVSD